MAIEAYKKEQERIAKAEREKANGGKPEEEAPEPITVKEILADNEKNALFGKMLEHDGDPADKEVMERLSKKQLEEADVNALEKYRIAFEKKMRRVENINEELTPELISEVANQSPEFKKILGVIDSETTTSMIKDRLADLSVSDPDRFNKFSKVIDDFQVLKNGGLANQDKHVKELCEKSNLNEGEFSKALAINDEKERTTALRGLVRTSWGEGFLGGTRRFIDSLGLGVLSKGRVETLGKQKDVIDGLLTELDNRKRKIGNVLASTIKGSPDMLNSLSKAILGEQTKVEQFGLKKIRESYPKEQQIDVKYGNFKKNIKINNVSVQWSNLTAAQKDDQKKLFSDQIMAETKKTAKGIGFWASIAEALFGAFLVEKLSKLD